MVVMLQEGAPGGAGLQAGGGAVWAADLHAGVLGGVAQGGQHREYDERQAHQSPAPGTHARGRAGGHPRSG